MTAWLIQTARVCRRLLRTPLFTSVAVLTLGVGIGANAALFGIVRGVILTPLPYPEPDRLVGVWHQAPGMNVERMSQGPAFYFTYRDEGRVFEQFGLWADRAASVTGVGEPERVQVLAVTDGVLNALGAKPAAGRLFAREDDEPGSTERVVLTFAYWQRRFGGSPTVLGTSLTVDGRPREVIGVLPASFRFLRSDPALILPLRFNRAETYIGNFSYQGIARLKPGVTIEQANADLARMIPIAVERFPLPPGFTREMVDEARLGPNVRPLADDVVGEVRRPLWVLAGMVGLVLLIACANVANLFLVRAEARQQELAVRAALGAGRGRLARELLAESLALGLAGGVVGAVMARGAIGLLVRLAPAGLPRLEEIAITPLVLLFTLGLSIFAGLLFGLLPVIRHASPRASALREGGRSVSDSRERHVARGALVIAEVALALLLLVGAGLMIRTFIALRQVDPGYVNPIEVLTLRLSIPASAVPDAEAVAQRHERIAAAIALVPGVEAVGSSSSVTMDGDTQNDPVLVEDSPEPPGRMPRMRRYKWIGPGYLEAMGSRLVAGRRLTWADVHARVPAALVSEGLAREYWPTAAAAIGRRIRPSPNDPWREIVGVVADERDDGLAQPAPAVVYWPLIAYNFWTRPVTVSRSQAYAVRSARAGSSNFLREIQQAVWSVDPGLPLANVRTLDAIAATSVAQTSFVLVMLALAAGVALLLGVVGVYGVIACVAAGRRREVGIRLALGAQRGEVIGMFLRQGVALVGTGVAVGLGAAAGLSRLMAAMLHGTSPLDPVTFAAVPVVLGAIALVAVYLPARRASRVDPVEALRADV